MSGRLNSRKIFAPFTGSDPRVEKPSRLEKFSTWGTQVECEMQRSHCAVRQPTQIAMFVSVEPTLIPGRLRVQVFSRVLTPGVAVTGNPTANKGMMLDFYVEKRTSQWTVVRVGSLYVLD